jgi:sigma-B regulation protein RsbU (phosphoserine phosphatase)
MRSEETNYTTQQWLALQDRALAVAAEGITIADARLPGRPLIFVNEGFERLTGYTAAEALGRNCKFLQGQDSDPGTVEKIRSALREERDCTVELLNYRKDGTTFWNRLSITPIRDEDGELTHFIGIQSDVTERRLAEETLRQANRQMRRDLEEAAHIQQSWLPTSLPEVPGFNFAWAFRPCEELAGDGLNIVRLDDDHVGIFILDVCGHGVPAALLSVSLNRRFSALPEESILFDRCPANPAGVIPATPVRVAEKINRQFSAGPATGKFFTLLYGILEISTRRFRYITAGHPPPVKIDDQSAHLCPLAKGLPIGTLPDFPFEDKCLDLKPGDRLLLYTDGAFEAIDENDQELGESRLLEAVYELRTSPPAEAVAAMVELVEQWCPGHRPQDDVTLLCFDVS